jgi:hypothetical protein
LLTVGCVATPFLLAGGAVAVHDAHVRN